MTKKKSTKKRTTKKKTTAKKKVERKKHHEKGPEYMVQISDPKMMRKDLLEGLRNIIVFMQGYEKFKRMQEEKLLVFSKLKAQVKELNLLINHKLKKHFPQGKLKPLGILDDEIEELSVEELPPVKEPVKEKPKVKRIVAPPPKPERISELDRLEMQLKDIEGQLQKIE